MGPVFEIDFEELDKGLWRIKIGVPIENTVGENQRLYRVTVEIILEHPGPPSSEAFLKVAQRTALRTIRDAVSVLTLNSLNWK